MGPQRIELNAHRVFSLEHLLALTERWDLRHFSYVDDAGDLFENAPLTLYEVRRNYGCVYGCAILELLKPG